MRVQQNANSHRIQAYGSSDHRRISQSTVKRRCICRFFSKTLLSFSIPITVGIKLGLKRVKIETLLWPQISIVELNCFSFRNCNFNIESNSGSKPLANRWKSMGLTLTFARLYLQWTNVWFFADQSIRSEYKPRE